MQSLGSTPKDDFSVILADTIELLLRLLAEGWDLKLFKVVYPKSKCIVM